MRQLLWRWLDILITTFFLPSSWIFPRVLGSGVKIQGVNAPRDVESAHLINCYDLGSLGWSHHAASVKSLISFPISPGPACVTHSRGWGPNEFLSVSYSDVISRVWWMFSGRGGKDTRTIYKMVISNVNKGRRVESREQSTWPGGRHETAH